MKYLSVLSVALLAILVLTSCANVQHNIKPCLEGHTYGFFGGLWHGFIAPFAFVVSLFSDNVAMWAVNNNGGWYAFGFVLGAGILGKSSSEATK